MSDNSSHNNKVVRIVIIVVAVLAVLAGAWYWGMYMPEQEAKEKVRLEKVAKEKAEKKRKKLAAQNKAKYKKLIENANSEFDLENWEEANSLYTEASSIFPDEQHPQNQLILVRAKLDEIAAMENKTTGAVEMISSATGRFYVVISSSIDDDLAMDYANKLTEEGNDVKIIGPDSTTTNKLYHRLSIGDYDTWDEAVAASSSFSSYADEVWVLKY